MKKLLRSVILSTCVIIVACSVKVAKADTTATEIPVNTVQTGNLETKDEIDMYSFTTGEDGSISLSFSSDVPMDKGWKISLLDNNKVPIAEIISAGVALQTSDYGYAAGTFYIQVVCPYPYSYYNKGNYKITANFMAKTDCETEYNDEYKTADSIDTNKEYSGNMYKATDVDWYVFTTREAGYVNLEFLNEYKDRSYWQATLYDSNRVPIYEIYNGEVRTATNNAGLPAGTYYVSVKCPWSSLYYSVDSYRIKINAIASDLYETEDNSGFATADQLEANKTYTGNLYKNSDEDYYKLTTTANGYFNVSFSHEYLNNDYFIITIYKKDKTPIYSFYNGDTKASTIKMGLTQGTYYIGVKSPWSSLYYTPQEYKLKVDYKKSSEWESEGNDSNKTADAITLKTSKGASSGLLNGNLLSKSDVDYYKVSFSKDGKATFTFNHTNAENVSYKITIFNEKKKAVATISNTTTNSKKTLSVPKGTYYVKVECESYYFSEVKYAMKISMK